MDFNFSIPVRVFSGEECIKKNSGVFASLGGKCFIVTGGSGAKISGALSDVTDALKQNSIQYKIYDSIGPNPLLSACREAGLKAAAFSADFVVGIGGGSALDAAKAAAVFAANPSFAPRDIYSSGERSRALPIVLVGTTAGTGSEVGPVAVLTDDETGRKKSISPADCFAKYAFADARYTHSVPFSVTVSTALDALAHAVEGYFSVKCGDIPSMFAEKAIGLIWKELRLLNETRAVPSKNGREALYYGSLHAGITLACCGTAFPHPLGYILTENYGVPHGTACAAFMPEFIDRAEKYENEKLNRMLSITGESKESFTALIERLTDLRKIVMTEDEVNLACSRFDDAVPNNFKFSPGGFTKADAIKALMKFVK